jgi:hypothetical protein
MAAVELSPNRYRQLDIPVVAGGVVEGLVRWADGSPSPHASRTAGIVLQAVHRETGEVRTLTTFSDGSFYAIGLRPGEWTLSVEGECLKFLEARTEPIQFTIRPDEAGDSVGGLSLTLE